LSKLYYLTRRNIKLFFASKSNMFFSMLAILILVGLHFIVFRKMNADSFLASGLPLAKKWALWLSDCLTLSTLIPIGAVTVSVTSLAQLVTDKEKHTIDDFYVLPLSKNTILASYLFSSFTIGTIVLTAFIIFFNVYSFLSYGLLFGIAQLFCVLGIGLMSLFLGNFFIMIIVSFVKREQAMGAIGTIVGTTIGFISGAYFPLGILGEKASKVLTFTPFLPLTALSRQAFFSNIAQTELTKEIIGGDLAKFYGYELYFGGEILTQNMLFLIVLLYICIFAALLLIRFMKMRKND